MAAGSRYGITLKELRELMEFRGPEGVEKIKEYGGATGLAKKLNTSESTGNIYNLMILKQWLSYILDVCRNMIIDTKELT